MTKRTQILKLILLTLLFGLATTAVLPVRKALAGNPFYPQALVYYLKNGAKDPGTATTPNSYATAWSYRNNVDGTTGAGNVQTNFCQTDSPPVGQIYAADGAGTPAYTGWDVGSSCWTSPAAVGNPVMIVLESKNGLNGYSGPTWVGGAEVDLTTYMVGNAEADFRDVVMEPIPTPALQSSTTSSITVNWQGLWDNTLGASGGIGPASVVGYSVYRSVDGGSFAYLGTVAQSAGSNVTYTDNTATNGHTYNYKLGVRFMWTAHAGGYYEPDGQGPASTNMTTAAPQPALLKFISSVPTLTAGTNSAVQSVQVSDASGNAVSVTGNTAINLATNSTSPNAKFYAVSGGTCTSTVITSVTVTSGSSVGQFCYYDEKAGSWTLTASSTGLTNGTQTATVTAAGTLGSLGLVLASPQKDQIAFTGTNTLTTKDAFGNTITTFNPAVDAITFTIAPTTAAISGLDGSGAQLTLAGDFSGGIANLTGKLKLSGTAGSYTITATSNSGKTTNASVTLGDGALNHFDFTLASPQSIVTAFTGTNTLTARDADNNAITTFDASATNVTITENAAVGTVSGLGSGGTNVLNRSSDFVNGVANLTNAMQYTGPTGSHVFKAAAGAVNSISGSVSFGVGPLAKFSLNLDASQTSTIPFVTATITAQDAYGNTVTTFDASANNVTLSASGTGSLNITQLTSSSSFVNGVADLSGSLAFTGSVGTHTITATSANGKTGSTSVNITALPVPALLKFISSAPTFPAGTTSAIQTVQSSDAGGNAINVTSDTVVNLATTSTSPNTKFYAVSGGVCTGNVITSVTITNGSDIAQFCYYDEKAGSWTLTASASGLSSGTQTATVTAASTLGALTLSLNSSQKDRIAFTGTNTLTAKDAFGNTITAFDPAADPITFTVAPTATISGLDGGGSQLALAGDFSSGVANLTSKLMLAGSVGTYTITATSNSGISGNGTVTLASGSLNHFDFTLASPQNVATAFTGTNTLTARDADNNIITTFDASTSNVTLTENGGVGTVSGLGSGGTNVLNRSSDFVNGVANLTGAMQYIGPVGGHTFKATAGSSTGTSNSVTFNPGPLAKFSLNINTPQANAQPFATATITAQDVYGNTITNFDASSNNVTLSVSGTGSLNTTSLASSGSFVNGVADLSGSLTFTGLVGSHTITATSANGKTGAATVAITPGTPTTAKIVNGSGGGATQVTTASLTADQTLPLWAAGYDVSGNWTGLLSGDWGSTGTLAPAVSSTAVNTITFAPITAPASGTITFTNGTLNAATGTITVTPGVVNHFIVNAPATATAGQPFSVTITAVDADGNQLTTYTGAKTIVFSGPGNAGAQTPTYPVSVTFNASGVGTATVTLVKAETTKLTATQGSISGQSGNIVVSAAPANAFTVSAPGSVTAGVGFTATITAYDSFGNIDTSYSGDKTVTFANPGTAPDGTPPSYPPLVTFSGGIGNASITLYKRETTTIKATESSLSGTSGTINVAATTAASIAKVSGDNQTGPVQQLLPSPLVVVVKDTYQNLKDGYSVNFAVGIGGGNISASNVTTATDGTAQVTWTLGNSPGTNNNTVIVANGLPLTGAPLTFTASASGNGFLVTTPDPVTAGTPFTITIKSIDVNGSVVTSYSGTKTIIFSGPSDGSNGAKPQYPVTVDFTNGVAQPSPSITLYAVETTTLHVTDGVLNGTSLPFTVRAGAASRLAIITAPQQLNVNQVSNPITVCLQDQYGNSVVATQDHTLDLSSTGPGGLFSSSASGPWTSFHATLTNGLSCTDVFYKDPYSGAKTIVIGSTGLVSATQAVDIAGTTPPPTSPPANGGGSTQTVVQTRTVTVYVDKPTQSTAVPSTSPTITVPLPVVNFPIITTPQNRVFVTPISGYIIVAGTAPASQTVFVKTASNQTLAATTSDGRGDWQVYIDSTNFMGNTQSIYAELTNQQIRSPSVDFTIKQPTLIEWLVSLLSQ